MASISGSGALHGAPVTVVCWAGTNAATRAPALPTVTVYADNAGAWSVANVAPNVNDEYYEITVPTATGAVVYDVSVPVGATRAYGVSELSAVVVTAADLGEVTSFNTRTGAVTLSKSDVTGTGLAPADIGAAPTASPALSGTPTAPTASALDATTKIATTAYADAAVAVEATRAATAEALLAPKASPALTGTPTIAGVSIFTFAGNPNTHVVALASGDLCIDTTTPGLWQASAADNSHWVAL